MEGEGTASGIAQRATEAYAQLSYYCRWRQGFPSIYKQDIRESHEMHKPNGALCPTRKL